MKKWMSVFLVLAFMLVLFAGCSGNQEENPSETHDHNHTEATVGPLCDGKTLRVLAIGNSFSNNTTEYLYQVAKAQGVETIIIGRLYIGGCTLSQHVNNAVGNVPAYTYYKNTTGTWESFAETTMLHALQDEQWDIITMQQSSANSGRPESYTGLVTPLVNYVNNNKTNPNGRLVWHMTWAYQQGSEQLGFAPYNYDQKTMYDAIVSTVKNVILPLKSFAAVIPAGTAIQNVRTSHIGDNVTRDTYHLNAMGMVTAAYCWYATFIEKPLTEVNLTQIESVLTLTDADRAAILAAVNAAITNPYAVTQVNVPNS